MTSLIKSTVFSPMRVFFRVSTSIPSMKHAREIFRVLGEYGDMIEYRFIRCPSTFRYRQYGFVVYRNSQDAYKAVEEQFIKVPPSELFDKPTDIKVERSTVNNKIKYRKEEN
ncbi:hypothetical protein RMATCC62417_06205 [Rhizopus microsporus]|nr:hypothetical protein RMATCC62417_06205 [Rhizopus microsporus]CEI92820.1 hypothetical protein RMCBS344292_07070 [Rhizopus microsporus]